MRDEGAARDFEEGRGGLKKFRIKKAQGGIEQLAACMMTCSV